MSNNWFVEIVTFQSLRYCLLPPHLDRNTQFSCPESSLGQLGVGGSEQWWLVYLALLEAKCCI